MFYVKRSRPLPREVLQCGRRPPCNAACAALAFSESRNGLLKFEFVLHVLACRSTEQRQGPRPGRVMSFDFEVLFDVSYLPATATVAPRPCVPSPRAPTP